MADARGIFPVHPPQLLGISSVSPHYIVSMPIKTLIISLVCKFTGRL